MKPREENLSHEELTRVLHYDPLTGLFTWKCPTSNRVKVGAVAGNITPLGYRSIQLRGYGYLAHRVAWFYMTGAWPEGELDHKNGDGLDNRWDNLRPATSSQNKCNTRLRRDNACGYKGVYLHKEDPVQYRARIKADGKLIELGLFSTPESAHAAYVEASAKYHQQYGRTR